jgi:general secretion pathway protein G
MSRNRARGFTLLELLVVVAIIGIVAAIATVAYFNALDRARQKRTIADMKSIAQAWEARASEMRSYGVAGFTFPATAVQYPDLSAALVPTYTRTVPQFDGWSRPYDYGIGNGPRDYAIRSMGRDGQLESGNYTPGETSNMDCDIIFSNGSFVVYPGSVQGE